MAEYDRLIAAANRLITAKGRPITVFREVTSMPVSTEPWSLVKGHTQSFPIYGVFQDPRNSEKNFDFAMKLLPETDIGRIDWHVYIPAEGVEFEPGPRDTILDGDATYRIVTCSPIKPGQQTIMYILQVQV